MRDDLKKKIELAHKRLSELENSSVGDLYDVRDALWSIMNPIVTQPPSVAELAEAVANLYPYTTEQKEVFDRIRSGSGTSEYKSKLITAAKLNMKHAESSVATFTGYNQYVTQCLNALRAAALLDAADQAAKEHRESNAKPEPSQAG